MYDSFEADFVFYLAFSLIRRALLGPAFALKRLVRLLRAGVSATQLVGTCTVFLKTDVWSHTQSLAQARHKTRVETRPMLSGTSPPLLIPLCRSGLVEIVADVLACSGRA